MKQCTISDCTRPAKARGMCGMHVERARAGRPLEGPPRKRSGPISDYYTQTAGGCWQWTGYIDQATGYGRFGAQWAHRASYEFYVGPIPDGLHIDHLCRNTLCVNPDHLEPVTPRENVLRGFAPTAVAARTDICQRGHVLTPDNVYIRGNGKGRLCKPCNDIRNARRYEVAS